MLSSVGFGGSGGDEGGFLKVAPNHQFHCFFLFNLKKIFLHLFIFERQRQSTSRGGTAKERETQNPKQAPGSESSAKSPTRGSNS